MLILCDVRVKFDERISQVFDVVSSDNHLLLVHVLAQFVIVLAYIFVVVLLFFLAPFQASCIPYGNQVSAGDWSFQR